MYCLPTCVRDWEHSGGTLEKSRVNDKGLRALCSGWPYPEHSQEPRDKPADIETPVGVDLDQLGSDRVNRHDR